MNALLYITIPFQRMLSVGRCTRPSVLLGALFFATIATQLQAESGSYQSLEGLNSEVALFEDAEKAISIVNKSAPLFLASSANNDPHSLLYPHSFIWHEADTWIGDIGTLLYKDRDRDGYFSGFSLSIDADSDYSHIDVYATIDIQREPGEPEPLHQTRVFSIYGNSSSDTYRVDIELLNNYPIGEYDLTVSLVDAQSLTVLDTLNANELSNLQRLPLESEELDLNHGTLNISGTTGGPVVSSLSISVEEYSGSTSVLFLLMLSLMLTIGRFRFTQSSRIMVHTQRIPAHDHKDGHLKHHGQLPGSTHTLLSRSL